MEKEKGQYEFLNIDNSAELHEKSPSSPMSKDYVGYLYFSIRITSNIILNIIVLYAIKIKI